MRLIEDMIELLESLGYEVTKKKPSQNQKVAYYLKEDKGLYNLYKVSPYETMGTGIEYLKYMIDG